MKYFTYELVAAANDWIEQSEQERVQAEERFWATAEAYNRELESLKPRLSRSVWEFFRLGKGRAGLHDATLLSLKIGDGLQFEPDGRAPLRLNRLRTAARLEFLNYEQKSLCVFTLRDVSSAQTSLFSEGLRGGRGLGDVYTYELIAASPNELQLGFLFATGATIVMQCRRVMFSRQRIARQYDLSDIYGA